ncbi:golgin subfamily A member 3 [Thalassophryne amazonica]|uniref:golgin subfamily A member 3 n=1 Tax=Thalassophryne amazonica TaxID=390379 RepID=UPI0014713715|nr:golgin subfamily A member 3 [Thalassophryne amazonica]
MSVEGDVVGSPDRSDSGHEVARDPLITMATTIRRFERFRIATALDNKPDEYQVNSLLYVMGDAADDVLAVLPLSDAEKKKYATVKEAFEKHYVGKHNVIFERAQFNSRRQHEGESAESFITALHKLAENCGFGVLKDELIRDRVVVGIRDKRLSEQLQMDSELTLAKAIQKVRQSESVKKQQLILHSSSAEGKTLNMDNIRTSMKRGKTQTRQKKEQRPPKLSDKERGRCGRKNKHSWKDCPAREVQCRKCLRKGHFAVVCRSSDAARVREVTESLKDTDSEDCVFLGEVGTVRSQPWMQKVKLNGENIDFKLDTGADVTSIPEGLYSPDRDGKLQKPKKTLLGPGSYPLNVKGCFGAQLVVKGHSVSQEVYLVSGLVQPLLSRPACEALGLVYRVNTVTESEIDFRAAYPDVFKDLGMLKEPYHIELEQGAIPVALSAPRRIPLPLRDAVRTELHRMEEMGVISKVTEPTEWCSGIVVIPRPVKKPPRICVDLTPPECNSKKGMPYSPSVAQTLAKIKDARVFTKLDARSGFWQIPLHPSQGRSQPSSTPFGRFQFNHLPFGIASGRTLSPLMPCPEHHWRARPPPGDLQLEKEVDVFVDCVVSQLPATDKRLEDIKLAQAELKHTTAEVTIKAVKEAFARHGVAETVVSDNGPQFSSDQFRQFAKEYQFTHITSSPRYPQANGEAERAVHTIKDLWRKDCDFSRALLVYRSTHWNTDNDALRLRTEVRQLNLKLSTCSATALVTTSCYQTQLRKKMKQLLSTHDSNSFLILQIIALTNEVNSLQKKLKQATNLMNISELQIQLEERNRELKVKTLQLERSHKNSDLILQIITLQNEIWDAVQAGFSKETSHPPMKIVDLQVQLDTKLKELQFTGEVNSTVLELIFVNSKIEANQKLIGVYNEKSTSMITVYQRQFKQKAELLKAKILELNDDESNMALTKEILALQNELAHISELKTDAKLVAEATVKEIKVILEEDQRQQQLLQKQLAENGFAQAQMIMKIINMIKELRELEEDDKNQTTVQPTTLQIQYAKAQAEIKELQKKLRSKTEECSGLYEKYNETKAEFEEKITQLNRTDSKSALVLKIINLHDELKYLRNLISTTNDQDRISELQRQFEEKKQELNWNITDLKRQTANSETILTIIDLQNEIWDLQNKAANQTALNHVKELENRLDGLIRTIEDRNDVNTKLMLRIMMLQNQVDHLEKHSLYLQNTHISEVTKLTNELTTKKNDLQEYINKLNEKNRENAELILSITQLHNNLKNLQREKLNFNQETSLTIATLTEQLKVSEEQRSRVQATVKELQYKVDQTEAQCSSNEGALKILQESMDAKFKELKTKSNTVTSLALQISALSLQLEVLQKQKENTNDKTKLEELQKTVDEKTKELTIKTEDLKAKSAQPQRFLQIVAVQTEIERLVNLPPNDTNYNNIEVLEDKLNYLIKGIQDENDESAKLMFQILAQRDKLITLKKQQENRFLEQTQRIKELENDLEDVRSQIKVKTVELGSNEVRVANLSADIMELHKKIKPLEIQISVLKETHRNASEELQKKLELTKMQLQDSESLLKDANLTNFNLIMDIADLRAQLQQALKKASVATAAEIKAKELEQLLETQQQENRKLKSTNKESIQKIKELQLCCSEVNQCDDLQSQLTQSQTDADLLHQLLTESESNIKQLQQQLDKEHWEKVKLQDKYKYSAEENKKLQEHLQALQTKLADIDDQMIQPKKVIFDPNTAHRRLLLSADNTVMAVGDEDQTVDDHPGRFDVILAVLGKGGFTGGRHYWEVSVDGKLCYHLGMASESSNRRGPITFSPTNGFWTIVLNKQGQYIAKDKRSSVIPVQRKPLILGILLDYKKGQISFYDAGIRSRIYSFVGQNFTNAVYPFISDCVEDYSKPITLLLPGPVDWI